MDFLNKNTILLKSSTLHSGILRKTWAFRKEEREEGGRERIFLDYLEARQGARYFSLTSCVINQGNLSDISNLSKKHQWDLKLALFICLSPKSMIFFP